MSLLSHGRNYLKMGKASMYYYFKKDTTTDGRT